MIWRRTATEIIIETKMWINTDPEIGSKIGATITETGIKTEIVAIDTAGIIRIVDPVVRVAIDIAKKQNLGLTQKERKKIQVNQRAMAQPIPARIPSPSRPQIATTAPPPRLPWSPSLRRSAGETSTRRETSSRGGRSQWFLRPRRS